MTERARKSHNSGLNTHTDTQTDRQTQKRQSDLLGSLQEPKNSLIPQKIIKKFSIIGGGGGQPDDGKFHHVFTYFLNPSLRACLKLTNSPHPVRIVIARLPRNSARRK